MNEPTHKAPASQILITVAAFVVVVAGMRASGDLLVPFLLSAFIAIISSPPLFWLKEKGLPTWLSLIIVVAVILSIGLVIVGLVGSSVTAFTQDLPIYDEKIRQHVTAIMAWLESHGVDTSGINIAEFFNPGRVMKLVAAFLNNLRKLLTNGFLILLIVIFMLVETISLPAKLHTVLGNGKQSLANFDKFISNVKNYMAIKTAISLATGVMVAVWLAILGVDYAMLWGLLAFVLNYVPNIGSIIAALPAVLLAFIQLGLFKAVAVAVGFAVINVVMGNVIEPRFMGQRLGLSTLVVFLSLLFWGWVLGPVGMLLSVPLTITAKIALDSREDTRWLSVLLGPEIVSKQTAVAAEASASDLPDAQ